MINLADQFDQASTLEQQDRELALQKQQQNKEQPLVINGVRCCLDCPTYVAILPKRIKAVNAVRCISCQVHHEASQKHQRG